MEIQLKKGVDLQNLHTAMYYAIHVSSIAFFMMKYSYTVTSGRDGKHMANSLHYKGRAIDIRTYHVKKEDLVKIHTNICAALTKGYDVVLEKDHIHIEYDPK